MSTILTLLTIQGIMGAFDNFWHHELTENLPSKPSAWFELSLHSARAFIYGIVFLALGWSSWHGVFAVILAILLIVEVVITLWDFLEEDMTRKLPPLERILHTVLALNYGAVLALLAPGSCRMGLGATANRHRLRLSRSTDLDHEPVRRRHLCLEPA